MKLNDLHSPFSPEDIHWRIGSTTKDKARGMALAYLDARNVMERLDSVCGPENWQDQYIETVKGRIMCTISIKLGDEWVGKSDGAGDTDIEGDKGGISDAFKRAAVKWGIGRYLYAIDSPWVDIETFGKTSKIKNPNDPKFAKALGGVKTHAPKPKPEAPPTDPTEDDKANGEATKSMVTACETVEALRDLSSSKLFNDCLNDLHPNMKEMVRTAWSARNKFLKTRDENKRVEASNDELTGNEPNTSTAT